MVIFYFLCVQLFVQKTVVKKSRSPIFRIKICLKKVPFYYFSFVFQFFFQILEKIPKIVFKSIFLTKWRWNENAYHSSRDVLHFTYYTYYISGRIVDWTDGDNKQVASKEPEGECNDAVDFSHFRLAPVLRMGCV